MRNFVLPGTAIPRKCKSKITDLRLMKAGNEPQTSDGLQRLVYESIKSLEAPVCKKSVETGGFEHPTLCICKLMRSKRATNCATSPLSQDWNLTFSTSRDCRQNLTIY